MTPHPASQPCLWCPGAANAPAGHIHDGICVDCALRLIDQLSARHPGWRQSLHGFRPAPRAVRPLHAQSQ